MSESNDAKNVSAYGQIRSIGKSTNIAWHHSTITKAEINEKNDHRSSILWFTGLSGSGKSTLANAVHRKLFERSIHSYVLDGDNIRHGINQDLGFSDQDRVENIRRVGEIARLFADAGMITLTAFVSPFRDDREQVRQLVKKNGGSTEDFIEIYCNADLKVCEGRDTKGLYEKARSGIIPNFTGITSPYEEPECPELDIDTGSKSLVDCVEQILKYLELKGAIPAK
jgi:adenylylsulfate kinase